MLWQHSSIVEFRQRQAICIVINDVFNYVFGCVLCNKPYFMKHIPTIENARNFE